MPNAPYSAVRLHALLGDAMHDLPRHFIEKLERIERALGRTEDPSHLSLVTDVAQGVSAACASAADEPELRTMVAVPVRTLQGLDAIMEILHAVHLGQHDGDREAVLSEHLVEGLIVSGRALVRASADQAATRQ